MEITSKRKFYELWEAGVLGNRTRIWRDPMDATIFGHTIWAASGHSIDIGFRQLNKAGGGAWCRVPWYHVLKTADEWKAAGYEFIMDDGAPDDKRTLQGEICRTEHGMQGFLEVGGGLPMRPAMAAGLMKHCSYLKTKVLLERYMDPSSRDDLDALLELYPNHSIEFSCFSVNVGVIPRRNTLFWETRLY